jgi:hypothetical protein
MHLRRLKVHGNPNYTTRTPNGEKLKWLETTTLQGTEDCILWPFGVGSHGYGYLSYDGSQLLAHHVVLILHHRLLPVGLEETRHLCDNKLCVNNSHLVVGEPLDNAADRKRAGTTYPGSQRYNAKLTEEDVKAIRNAPEYWGICRQLARKYGVSHQLISDLRNPNNPRWNHI